MEAFTEEDRLVLGPYLKILCQRAGLTQRQLSTSIGIDRGTISRVWRGKVKSSKHYTTLCKQLDITFELALERAYEHDRVTSSTPAASTPEVDISEDLGLAEQGGRTPQQRSKAFGADALIITVAAEKGGVGKTALAVTLASVWAERGHRVLLVDLDTQGNATTHVGATEHGDHGESMVDALSKREPGEDPEVLVPLATEFGFDVVCGGRRLARASSRIQDHAIQHVVLGRALAPLARDYDLIVLDTPPALGAVTTNALACSRYVVIPIQCESAALEGAYKVCATIQEIRQVNSNLEMLGSVPTMVQRRLIDEHVLESIYDDPELRAFKVQIPRRVEVAEAYTSCEPLNHYAKGSTMVGIFEDLVDAIEGRFEQ